MATLAELQTRLASYYTAEQKILESGQAYSVGSGSGDRANTRADLGKIQSAIRSLEQQIAMHPENTSRGQLSHSQAVFGGRR
ncbi:MAG: hypothetical protein EOL92_00490 [Bacteroidia bacterium]|nr:hypothetical protein [Bacteroidia bacterium]